MENVEICAVGGYNEVGRNMTALKVGNETIIWDMGINVGKLAEYQEETPSQEEYTLKLLQRIDAIPHMHKIQSWIPNTKAICISHCHIDHIGSIPFLAPDVKAPIIATPYTMEVIKNQLDKDSLKLPNELRIIKPHSTQQISENIKIEYINIPHSTPECSLLVAHTKKGNFMYATDWKFDNTPTLGPPPDYKRLKQLGKEGIKTLVINSLYSSADRKTPSEKVAVELLHDVLFGIENSEAAIVTTCFASHIARIKTIIEFAKKLNRKVIILGRSFSKYISAAETAKITKLSDQVDIAVYRSDISRILSEINKKGAHKYLIICTGGQGEKNAVLSRIIRGELKFKFYPDDHIIFSNKVIPVEPNITNRGKLERHLKEMGVRIFNDVHVSGHCSREDIREMIKLVNPETIIPCHGTESLLEPACGLAEEMGYKINRDIHLMKNGEKIIIE